MPFEDRSRQVLCFQGAEQVDSGVGGGETLDDFSTLRFLQFSEGVPNHLQLGEHLLSDAAFVPIQGEGWSGESLACCRNTHCERDDLLRSARIGVLLHEPLEGG